MRPSPDSCTRGPTPLMKASCQIGANIDPLVDQLLDPLQRGLAALGVELGGLLLEQPVDVGVAAVDVGAAGGDEGLQPRGRVAEGAARAWIRFLSFFSP